MFASFNLTAWATRLVIALLFMLAGAVLGWRFAGYKCAALDVAADGRLVAASVTAQQVTDQAVTQFVDSQATRSAARAELKKDITHEVPADIVLPPVYRVLHDAAATGAVPGAADLADARAVGAQDLAETVAENYGACEANRQQLISLQEWVRNQHGILLQ